MAAFSSLRVRLMLLVVLAMIPALAFILFTDIEQRTIAETRVNEDALRITRLASASQERFIEGAHQLLLALSELPVVRSGNAEPGGEVLAGLLEQYPLYANFGVTDADGMIYCSALPIQKPVPVADRRWFQEVKKTRDFAIGEFQIGRITKKPTLNFAYPLLDASGRFTGSVFAALDLNWVNQLAANAKLPPGASIFVADLHAMVLARSPDPEKWVGKTLPADSIMQAIVAGGGREGVAEGKGIDGIMRLYAFTSLKGAGGAPGAYVSVGIPKEIAFAAAHRMLMRNLIFLGAVFALALTAAWFLSDVFVLRRVKSLLRTTGQLSAGNLGARTGLEHDAGELGRLAHAFDDMASSLELRVAERTKAEQALQASEKRFRDLFEFSPDPIFVEDLNGNVIDANPAACRLHATTREEMIQKNVTDLVPASIRGQVTQMFAEWSEGSVVSLESLSLRSDGAVVPVEIRASCIDHAGRAALLFHVRDVTARKQAEDDLRRAHSELEMRVQQRTAELAKVNEALQKHANEISDLYNHAPCGYHSLDGEGVFVRVNDTELTWLGFTREEFVGRKKFAELLTPEGLKTFRESFPLFKQRGMVRDVEYDLIRKDGSILPVLLNATAVKDAAGNFVMSRSTIVDLTEHRHAADHLLQVHNFLDSIVENLPNILFVKEAQELRYVRFNKAGEELLGCARADLLGKNDYDLFPQEEADFFTAKDREVLSSGKLMDIPEEEIKTRGELRILHTKKIPIFDAAGRVQYLLGISEDITERIAAKQMLEKTAAELQRSNQELEQFAYVASHDLQEPLRMVASYTQLLERRYGDKLDADAHEFIGYAVDGAKRMQNFINDLLEYSRVGRRGRLFEPVDVAAVVAQAEHNLQIAIAEKQAVITKDPLPTISGDPVQLTQLFQNLTANAIKFRGEKSPRVHIGAQRGDGAWIFSVRDNGIGIDPQCFDRIFVIFQRLHSREEYAGTGIGLSVCKKIVERHGGRIWVESKKGEGTTFFLTIPDEQG